MAEVLENKKDALLKGKKPGRKGKAGKKRKRKAEVESTPKQKYEKALELKQAIRCMFRVKDQYTIYLKLAEDFEALSKKDLPESGEVTYDFEGQEQCPLLADECREKAASLVSLLPTEEEEEEEFSRTVTVTEKQRKQEEKRKNKGSGKGKWIAVGVVILAIAAIAFFRTNRGVYTLASIAEVCGFRDQAKDMFQKSNYKDFNEQASLLEKKNLKDAKKGSTVVFGKANTEWIVLDRTEQAVLLLKEEGEKDILYHDSEMKVSWENCDARKYLNSSYMDKLFTESEKALICRTQVKAAYNAEYGTGKTDNATADSLYILSSGEMKKYKKYIDLTGNNMRLRNPGKEETTTAFMTDGKEVVYYGFPVNQKGAWIHPVMWVSIN